MIDDACLIPTEFDSLDRLLGEWRQRYPRMGVLALVPEAGRQHVSALQAACRAGNIPLTGAIFPAIVTNNGFASTQAWLLRFDEMPRWFLLPDLNSGQQPAADSLAAAARKVLADSGVAAYPPPTLFMIFDGMLPNIASILNAVYAELKARIRYAGVNAGSETFQPMPCLFDRENTLGNGVLGLLLPAQNSAVVAHGYPVSRSLMKATSTDGNRIVSIDDRPAFDVYRQVIKTEYGVDLTHENFYDYAVHYPFGVVTAIDVLVRIPVAFNGDGSLFCVGEVPPNAMLRLLQAPAFADSTCIETIARRLGPPTHVGRDGPLLTFYCAGRRMHFGEAAAEEIVRLKTTTGATTLCGALSLGEIDCMEDLGLPRFHNATLVCMD